jgi:hypothetical protein
VADAPDAIGARVLLDLGRRLLAASGGTDGAA